MRKEAEQSTDFGQTIIQAMAGNEEAFEAVYTRYFGRVCNFLSARGLDEDQAADAAQDTLITIWQRQKSFTAGGESGFNAWVYTIAHNKGVSETRKKKTNILG